MTINLDTLPLNETLDITGGEGFFVLNFYRVDGRWVFERFICLPSDSFHTDPMCNHRILERSSI